MWGGRTLPSKMQKRIIEYLLLWELIVECDARKKILTEEDINEEEIPSFPSWIHSQAMGWTRQVIWLPCSTVGRNVAVPFVSLRTGSYMLIFSFSVWMIICIWCNASSYANVKYFQEWNLIVCVKFITYDQILEMFLL